MLDSSSLYKAKGEEGGVGFRLHERPAGWLRIQSRFSVLFPSRPVLSSQSPPLSHDLTPLKS